MLTDPVAETNEIRGSSANFWPTVLRSPISKLKIAGSAPVSRQTRSAIFVTAIAVSGVFSDGFQMVASPQTAARAAFQDESERMPLLHQTMVFSLRLNRQAVKHARLADGEIADVDHLLNFAFTFGND